MHGVLPFLKPVGMTSHDAVSFARRMLGTKRIGHTGTLDPAACGVLPLCVGQATRLVEYLQEGRKEYVAEITLGIETDTLDAVGKTVHESDASHITEAELRAVLPSFIGAISQTPPLFSAIKRDGKKLYELARDGVEESEAAIEARQVVIHALEITRFPPHMSTHVAGDSTARPRFMLRVECGSGTYIRSLARDIGRALGSFATMTFLVRTKSGFFSIDNCKTVEDITSDARGALLPVAPILRGCAARTFVDDAAVEAFSHGKTVRFSDANRDMSTHAQGEYAQGEYAQGEYAQGEYAQGEYAQGEYAQGEYAQGEAARVLFLNGDESRAALVRRDSEGQLFRAEKVFDFRTDAD